MKMLFRICIRRKSNYIHLTWSVMTVLYQVYQRYVYGCLVEAYASEHNARMMAMQVQQTVQRYAERSVNSI